LSFKIDTTWILTFEFYTIDCISRPIKVILSATQIFGLVRNHMIQNVFHKTLLLFPVLRAAD